MRSRTAKWFICKIRYEKVNEDGLQKKVTEIYVVDALSFSEAEARITEEMKNYISGQFDILNIDPAPFAEIFFSDEETADRWYKAVTYLVQAGSFDKALKSVNEVMGGTMIDYVTAKIEETKIMDVFEYAKKEKADDPEDEDL